MSKHLLTGGQFKELARPTSLHVDDAEINAYVRECEDVHIIPAIGYARFKQLTESEDLSDADKVLLEGGEWVQKVERCECRAEEGERLQYCKGLRCALAYFVYEYHSIKYQLKQNDNYRKLLNLYWHIIMLDFCQS